MQNPASLPLFDHTVFDELKELIGDDAYELIGLFAEIGPSLAAQITTAAASRDLAGITTAAHTLKSNSAQLGALRLGAMCRELEELSRNNASHDYAGEAAAITREVQNVIAELQRLRPV